MTNPEMQAKIGANLAQASARHGQKIHVTQAKVDYAGQARKHVVVELRGDQTIAGVLEDPDAWSGLQADGTKAFLKGDLVSLWSPDGLALADSAMVVKSEGGRCWFSKPLRMVSFEVSTLYRNDMYEVVASGTGFAIKTIRDGETDYSRIFPSAKSAEIEISRRQPVKVA